MIRIGDPAPSFSLQAPSKEWISLEALRGRVVILAFIPGAFTSLCARELCTLRDTPAFHKPNVATLAISVDSPFANAAFAEQQRLNFPILSDHPRTTTWAYGLALYNFADIPGYTAARRAVFVLDQAGVIRYAWIAENPGNEPDYDGIRRLVDSLAETYGLTTPQSSSS